MNWLLERQNRIENKLAKRPFELTIMETSFIYLRREQNIKVKVAFDVLRVIRSIVPKETTAEQLVSTYSRLAQVERAFRSMESVDLYLRPIYRFNDESHSRSRVPVHAGLLRRMAHA